MKIGIVEAGRIGGLIGTLWSRAGHEVFSSRHPESLAGLVAKAGNSARSGTPDEAISFGDAILLSIPFGELPEFGRTKREALSQKIVLETGNPNLKRDGEIAESVPQIRTRHRCTFARLVSRSARRSCVQHRLGPGPCQGGSPRGPARWNTSRLRR